MVRNYLCRFARVMSDFSVLMVAFNYYYFIFVSYTSKIVSLRTNTINAISAIRVQEGLQKTPPHRQSVSGTQATHLEHKHLGIRHSSLIKRFTRPFSERKNTSLFWRMEKISFIKLWRGFLWSFVIGKVYQTERTFFLI